MRRAFLLINLVLTTALVAAQEPLKRPTLEALFEDRVLELEKLDNLMWLPDGEHILYWTSQGDENDLWQQSIATGERALVADWAAVLDQLGEQRPGWHQPSPGDVNSSASHRTTPVLSPDGKALAGSAAGDLFLFDLETASARFLTGDSEQEIFPAFSPDGTKIGFNRSGDTYWLDLASGVVHRVTDRGEKKYLLNGVADWVYQEELDVERSFWWSPDSAHIAFLQFVANMYASSRMVR